MKFSSASVEDSGDPAKKSPTWQPNPSVEIVAWSGPLEQLLALLQITRADFERGLRGKSHVRR